MILRASPTTPYGRKVKILAKLLGMFDRLEILDTDLTNPEDSVHEQNPLGKIPVLVLEDGTNLYDSRVIAEYLNDTFNGSFFPKGGEKYKTLVLQATADGICDAAVSQVFEKRWRQTCPKLVSWLDDFAQRVPAYEETSVENSS